MGIAAALLVMLWSPAFAAEPPSGCLGRVESALRTGKAAPAASCFESGSSWLDEEGAAAGPEGALAGLTRLAGRASEDPALRWVRLSTGTWMLTGAGRGITWRHLVLELSARGKGFKAGRVYRGARPWEGEDSRTADVPRPLGEFIAAFNGLFGRGNTDALIAKWAPDAAFVSGIGPFEGKEIPGFFRRQALRYDSPRFVEVREHEPAPGGATVFEGVLEARCRAGGAAFRFPFLMRLRWYGDRIGTLYEAFSTFNDGCGMFWTAPH